MASVTTNNSMSPRRMSENHGSSPTSVAAQSRRPPWTQIVRGESEHIAAAPSSPQSKPPIEPIASVSVAPPPLTVAAGGGDEKSEESGAQGNAWKRPSNGVSEVAAPFMGASWPALSEATKAPSNRSSSDSLKSLGDVPSSSLPVSQGVANVSVPASKQVGRGNPNPTPNNSRQKSFKQRNGPSGSAVSQPSAHGSSGETPSHNPSPRGQNQKNGFAADNQSQRDSHRNQNGHHHHHQSHGGRRNQEHGNQNWNFNKSFNGRDGNAHSQRGAPPFVRHAPPPPVQQIPPQFMAAPQPIPPFGSPVPFSPELASPYYPRMPFIAPIAPAPVFYHVQDPPPSNVKPPQKQDPQKEDLPLNVKLQNQIHYYFSEENLIRDTYLRGHMDDQGFVSLHVIAGFKKVAQLKVSVQQIVEALQGSPVVEVQGDRIRKRYNWQNWLLPKGSSTPGAASSPRSVESPDAFASRVGNLSLHQSSAEPVVGGSSSQLQQTSGVDSVSNHSGSDGANR